MRYILYSDNKPSVINAPLSIEGKKLVKCCKLVKFLYLSKTVLKKLFAVPLPGIFWLGRKVGFFSQNFFPFQWENNNLIVKKKKKKKTVLGRGEKGG